MTTKKTKLPHGWERCRTGTKGVRKWRNIATKCWVTDHADDPDTLHCGVRGVPSKRPRCLYTPEQAMRCIDSECADHAESLSPPNEDLRAKLELADERAFFQAARIARLEAELSEAFAGQAGSKQPFEPLNP